MLLVGDVQLPLGALLQLLADVRREVVEPAGVLLDPSPVQQRPLPPVRRAFGEAAEVGADPRGDARQLGASDAARTSVGVV